MGTWNTEILGNDVAMDVYAFFEKLYNKQELEIETIKQKTISEFSLMDKNNQPVFGCEEWLAYAQICWECKAIDKETINIVKEILNDKEGIIENWEDLAKERVKEIEKFYTKIQSPPKRKKRIKKEYIVNVPFKKGDCIIVELEDKKYSVVILLDINKKKDTENMWTYFLATTRIYSENKPTIDDIIDSHFLMINYGETWEGEKALWIEKPKLWFSGQFVGDIKNEKEKQEIEQNLKQYEVITNIEFKTIPELPKSFSYFSLDNGYQLKSQLNWEKQNPNLKDLSHPIKKYLETDNLKSETKNKKKWKFWWRK